MKMNLFFAKSGGRENRSASSRRFNPQAAIPQFVLVGDMIRPVPLEGVVPQRRVGERPAGPLFEARTLKPSEPAPKKPAVQVASAPSPVASANPFSGNGVTKAKVGFLARLKSGVAALFKRSNAAGSVAASGVQPELRLDAVKPLRNELADVDFGSTELQVAPVPIMVAGTVSVPEAETVSARTAGQVIPPSREVVPATELVGKP